MLYPPDAAPPHASPDFSHVFWLGGSACAGKSSVAGLLAERLGLAVYALDDEFARHRERASPALHPGFCALMDLPPEALWERPAAEQATALLAFHRDQLALAREDLAALASPVLAEGVGVLPELLAPGARAAFLVAGGAWRRQVYPQRGNWVDGLLADCPEPEGTFERWMARDDRVAGHIARQARRRGFPILAIDGRQSVAEVAAEVTGLLRTGEARPPSSGDAWRLDP